ncbi:hypothetical protein ACFOG5_17145 [Pedobacter fastidiosus]|uniref:Internalin A n=1 Tax=Pedobacter fastidiosus TaxID=2765361 RepID=A0ABR7KRJ4_9SPHI|nr:hypothetical protein [Pedobacter fastidiosus]MBC6110687.1 hypothetical protein [Pedobacter fastidiosus]
MEVTYNKDGFTFFKSKSKLSPDAQDSLIIEFSRIDQLINYIKINNITSIMVNSYYSKITNLDFLREITQIESLKVLDENLNFEMINHLTKLKELRVGNVGSKVDFGNLKDLEVLGIIWNKHIDLRGCEKLSWLWIDCFNEYDLSKLSSLKKIKCINLISSSIVNLNGVAKLTFLESLNLDGAKKLVSLEDLSLTNKNLYCVDIYNAKNLFDYEHLSNLINLQSLRLIKTGEIDSIVFLQRLAKLNKVALGMKVLDGNLKILQGVPEHFFKNYPHYNYKSPKFSIPIEKVE